MNSDRWSEGAVIEIVKSLGAKEHSRTEENIWFTTVCHGGDSSKLCYYRKSKDFYCFTNCGFLSLPGLVSHALHISTGEALRYIENYTRRGLWLPLEGESYEEEIDVFQEALDFYNKPVGREYVPKVYNSNVLDIFEKDVFYQGWLDEGISSDTMKRFGIRWDEIEKQIVIPHLGPNGELLGIRGRRIGAEKGKYLPLIYNDTSYAHPLGMNLYGYWQHFESIKRTRQAVIFEGEKSVMKHHTWYGESSNAVAVCGFHVSDRQRELLLKLGVTEVILGFDKDVSMKLEDGKVTQEYERYCEKVNSIGRQFSPYCHVYALVDYGDALSLKDAPVDEGREAFEELMRKRQVIY